jgi:hypothetical protein
MGSGQQQTEYESETPSDGLRFADKASRIFGARRPIRLSGRLRTRPFRLAAGTKSRQIRELPNREHTWSALSQRPSDVKSWAPKPSVLRRLTAPIRDEGEGSGHKWSRNQRRGARRDSRRERQSQFASPWRRGQVMVAKAFRPAAAHCPDPRRARKKRAQREPESATQRADRFAARKATPIRLAAGPQTGHGAQCVDSA